MTASHHKYTLEEYLRLEEYSNVRHEYLDGQIYAMAGGSPEHGTFAANVIAILGQQLRGQRCRVQTSDVRVRVQATGLDTYPDVSVICGRVELDDQDASAVVNPTVLVEVLSPSTEDYDLGEKLSHYKQIPSLREVLFVAHDAKRLTLVRRAAADEWEETQVDQGAVVLESLGCELAVEDVYRDPLAE